MRRASFLPQFLAINLPLSPQPSIRHAVHYWPLSLFFFFQERERSRPSRPSRPECNEIRCLGERSKPSTAAQRRPNRGEFSGSV